MLAQGDSKNQRLKLKIQQTRDVLEDDYNINRIIQLENELADKQKHIREMKSEV